MTFKATYDNVVVRPIDEEKTSSGGIVLTARSEKTHNKGLVIFVGEGRRNKEGTVIPVSINVGDTVLFGLQSGIKVVIGGEECLVVKEEDIFAVEG